MILLGSKKETKEKKKKTISGISGKHQILLIPGAAFICFIAHELTFIKLFLGGAAFICFIAHELTFIKLFLGGAPNKKQHWPILER